MKRPEDFEDAFDTMGFGGGAGVGARKAAEVTLTAIRNLVAPSGWVAIKEDSRRRAMDTVVALSGDLVRHSLPWRTPQVSTEDDGNVLLRWHGPEQRTLTLVFGPTSTAFLRAWGTDIVSQMNDGTVNNDAYATELLAWLRG